ncbi:MAG: DUF1311 domain-containing protein [Candidatus Competibacteraceae bacterium]|nr:DUF1311 domain-containing protein [Candidatus Competibacteraceae bacterium]
MSNKALSRTERKKLKESQEAWLNYRDASLELITEVNRKTGSTGNFIIEDYRATLVKKRASEIEVYTERALMRVQPNDNTIRCDQNDSGFSKTFSTPPVHVLPVPSVTTASPGRLKLVRLPPAVLQKLPQLRRYRISGRIVTQIEVNWLLPRP